MALDYTKTSEQRARDLAKAVIDAVNEASFDAESFADEITEAHRTLQQNTMRAFWAVLREWAQAKRECRWDLRNQQTVELSSKIIEQFDEEAYFPYV